MVRIIGSISAEWAKAQDVSLTGQLDGGARYLDIRVCPPETSGGSLMICHGVYSTDLPSALNQIKTFALAHPKEIVLADFSPLTKSGGYTPTGDQHWIARPPNRSRAAWAASCSSRPG